MTKQCWYCSYPNIDNATRCINCGMELKTYWDKSDGETKLIRIELPRAVELEDSYFTGCRD